MYYKIFTRLPLLIILALVQIAFLSVLPFPLSYMKISLLLVVFTLILSGFETAVWVSVGFGFLLDIFSPFHFGYNTFTLACVTLVLNLMLTRYFTNRSLYTFLSLTAIAVILSEFARFLLFLPENISRNFLESAVSSLPAAAKFQAYVIAIHIGFAGVAFYALNFLSNRFKPVFISFGKK